MTIGRLIMLRIRSTRKILESELLAQSIFGCSLATRYLLMLISIFFGS